MAEKRKKSTFESGSKPRQKQLRLDDFQFGAQLITEREGQGQERVYFSAGTGSLLLCIGYSFLVQIFKNLQTRRMALNDMYHRVKAGSVRMEIARGVPIVLRSFNSHAMLAGLLVNGLAQIQRKAKEEGVIDARKVKSAVKGTFQSYLPFCYALQLYLRGQGLLAALKEDFHASDQLSQVLYDMSTDLRGEALDWVCRGLGIRATLSFREEFRT